MKKSPTILADLVKKEGFDHEKWSPADRVKITPSDLVTTKGDPRLYRFEQYGYCDGQLFKEMEKDGYRLGTLGDLIEYAKKNPEEQRHYNIFSLGNALIVDVSHPEDDTHEYPYIGVDCLDKKLRILSSRSIFQNGKRSFCNLSSEDRIIAVPKEKEGTIHVVDESVTFEVDFSKQPHVPKGWMILPESRQIKSRIKTKIQLSSSKIGLHRDKSQMYRNTVDGLGLKEKLKRTPVLGAQLLDFLVANPQLIPKDLKDTKANYLFWGTLYLNDKDMLCVRYLYHGTIYTGKGSERKIEWCAPTSGYYVLRDKWEPHTAYYLDFDDPAVILI